MLRFRLLPTSLLVLQTAVQNNYQPREVVYTSIAAQAVLAGLSLWKGFE